MPGKVIHLFILSILSLLATVCPAIQIGERNFIFPRRYELPTGFGGADFTFQGEDGARLGGRYFKVPGARATLLCFEGNATYLDRSADRLAVLLRMGCNLAMVEYRGYGRSQGTPTIEWMKRDADKAWEAVGRLPGVDPKAVILHGYSLGSFFAIILAAKVPAMALILEAPISNAKDYVWQATPWYAVPFASFDFDRKVTRDDNVLRAPGVRQRALILVGSQDRQSPPSMARKVFEALGSPSKKMIEVPGAGHGGFWNFKEYEDGEKEFIRGLTQKSPVSSP